MNDIPDWAGKRACELLNADTAETMVWVWPAHKGYDTIRTVAKLVMQHETAPIDPDEEAVKRIFAAYNGISVEDAHFITSGFARAVSQYKQEKGNG